jgi:hypothetical protein
VTAKHLRCCAVELEHEHQRYVDYVRACRRAATDKKLDTAADILEHLMGSGHTVAVQTVPHVIVILETLRLTQLRLSAASPPSSICTRSIE